MAEAFGIVSGAVGIASIFSTCVQCFDYIQVGRRFGKDFQTNILTLNLLRLRLTRWGKAVGIYNDPQLGNPTASAADISLAKDVMYQILVLFADSRKFSLKYDLQALPEDSSALSSAGMEAELSTLNNKMRELAAQRQSKTNILKITSWALHDKERFSKLIESIAKLLDELEKLFPAPEKATTLVEEELNQIGDGQTSKTATLKLLHDLATGIDGVMKAKTADMISMRGTSFGQIMVNDNARVRNGDVITSAWKGEKVLPTGSGNMNVVVIETGGNARVHNGNTYTDVDDFWD